MYVRVRQGLLLALSDVIDAFVVPGKHTSREDVLKEQRHTKISLSARVYPNALMLLPSDVHKQVLCSLVDVEDLIPEQTEAGGALQSQLPQRQRCCVAVQHRMTQDETDWRENREGEVTECSSEARK